MKTLVVYESNFGNTKLIADEIARELSPNARSVSVRDIGKSDLEQIELIIVGSPIHAWRPTQNILWFIYRLNDIGRKGVKAAAFDTRIKTFFSGNAAKKIANALSERGFKIIDKPTGFFVKGNEGPLLEGEISRAQLWAKQIHSEAEKI